MPNLKKKQLLMQKVKIGVRTIFLVRDVFEI